MNWLKSFFTASVGKKFVMGLTGLFLCFFLVAHLFGNLMLYIGADAYNEYAHKLHSNKEFLLAAEVLLFSAFVFHIAYGIWLHFGNKAARSQSYAMVRSKRTDRTLNPAVPTPDRLMFVTGLIILMFLMVHLSDFKLEIRWDSLLAEKTAYQKADIILNYGFRGLIYLVGAIVVGIHVSHGLQSAFQSLGFNHSKYTPMIRTLSIVFGFVVAIGFGSFPIAAWMGLFSSAATEIPTAL